MVSHIGLFPMPGIILIIAVAPRLMICLYLYTIYTNDTSFIDDTVVPLLTSLPFYAVETVSFSLVSGTRNTQRALFYEIITLSGYVLYTWLVVVYLRLSAGWIWSTEHVN